MVILAAVVPAGCGSESDEDQVKEVVGDYLAAAADGNGDEACEKLTPEAEREFTALANTTCERGIEQISKNLNEPQREKAKGLELDAKVDGEKATVTYAKSTGSGRSTVRLEKREGDWLIASSA